MYTKLCTKINSNEK